jgi:MFS family permease
VSGDDVQRRVRLARCGYSFIALAALGMAACATTSAAWLAYPAWSLAGLGAGLTMSTLSVLLLRYTTDADRGRDSSSLQLSDVTSSALTTGIGGALVAAAAAGVLGYRAAFGVLDVAMAAVALLGAFSAVRLRAPHGSVVVPQPS